MCNDTSIKCVSMLFASKETSNVKLFHKQLIFWECKLSSDQRSAFQDHFRQLLMCGQLMKLSYLWFCWWTTLKLIMQYGNSLKRLHVSTVKWDVSKIKWDIHAVQSKFVSFGDFITSSQLAQLEHLSLSLHNCVQLPLNAMSCGLAALHMLCLIDVTDVLLFSASARAVAAAFVM
jgi:hypothetical protein